MATSRHLPHLDRQAKGLPRLTSPRSGYGATASSTPCALPSYVAEHPGAVDVQLRSSRLLPEPSVSIMRRRPPSPLANCADKHCTPPPPGSA